MKRDRMGGRESGALKLQVAIALAAATAVAVLTGAFVSQPWASGQEGPLHGISFAKGCEVPTIVGETYKCNFLIRNNIDGGGDTLTVTSLVDVVHAAAGDVSSGNVLPTLSFTFSGGASCNAGQTLCTLPFGSSIETSAPLAFYTPVASDPNPLTDDALLTWQDTCSSGAQNCPNGDQTISTGSQSPLHTTTPTNTPPANTSTPGSRSEPSNTPRAETATPRPDTPTPASTVAAATVVPPTPRPSGVTALPATGDGGDGGSGLLAALVAGAATFGVLLVGSRVRALRSSR